MSRTLLPAFLMALILHSLLALVELKAFKSPVSIKVPPKTLTIDIVKPRPVKKPPLIKSPSIVVKEPVLKKKITKKVKPKPRVEPKKKEKERTQTERLIRKEEPTKKNETIAYLLRVDLPAVKKEDTFLEEDNSFVSDMVDIPMALPKIKRIPDSPFPAPVTYALPIYKKNIAPKYPLLARRRGYQGKVLLEVLVRKDGKAGSIRLSKSSGYEILDRAAIKGVKDWLFHPAKRGDELVEMWVEIPIRFQIK